MNNAMPDTKREIIQKLKKYLLNDKMIIFAYLHGSFLSEEIFNDIDIAVYIDGVAMNNITPVDFEIDLSLKLEKIIGFPVDVKILNSAILSFRYQISTGLLLFSRDENKREDFLCKAWSEYFDFLPMARVYLKEVLSG